MEGGGDTRGLFRGDNRFVRPRSKGGRGGLIRLQEIRTSLRVFLQGALASLKALEERSQDQFPLKSGKLGRANSPPSAPRAPGSSVSTARGLVLAPACPALPRPRPAPTLV